MLLAFVVMLQLASGARAPAGRSVALQPLVPRARAIREGVDSLVTWSFRGDAVHAGVRYERSIRRVSVNGRPRLRAEAVWHDSAGAVSSRTTSDADAATLMPIVCRVRAARDSASFAVVDGRLIGWTTLVTGQQRQQDDPIAPGTIAPELDDATVASLPLEAGLRGTLDVLGAQGGVSRRVVSVLGPDTLDAAGKVRDCWVVRLGTGSATDASLTLWIDRTTRRVWQRRGDHANFSWFHRATNP